MNLMKRTREKSTDVFRGSTEENWGQNTSNLRMFHYESTMLLCHYVEILERCCGSSTGPGGRATFECFPAARHLQDCLTTLKIPY
jgi:hypothetical protein